MNIQDQIDHLSKVVGFNQKNHAVNMAGLTAEVGEVADILAKLHFGKKIKDTDNIDNLKEKLALEIADVCVYLVHIATSHDINIEDAVMNKCEIIKKRSFK